MIMRCMYVIMAFFVILLLVGYFAWRSITKALDCIRECYDKRIDTLTDQAAHYRTRCSNQEIELQLAKKYIERLEHINKYLMSIRNTDEDDLFIQDGVIYRATSRQMTQEPGSCKQLSVDFVEYLRN